MLKSNPLLQFNNDNEHLNSLPSASFGSVIKKSSSKVSMSSYDGSVKNLNSKKGINSETSNTSKNYTTTNITANHTLQASKSSFSKVLEAMGNQ